jgi:hypothetical protein
MTAPTCRNYDRCSAPLCPNDAQSLKDGLWYPDEEICVLRNAPDWVRRQRKIAKRTKGDYRIGFFCHRMLDRNIKVSAGIKGLDPEKDLEPQLSRWLDAHPGMKPLTEEERDRVRARFKVASIRASKQENRPLTGA